MRANHDASADGRTNDTGMFLDLENTSGAQAGLPTASSRGIRFRGIVKTATAAALRITGADRLIGGLTGARSMPLVLAYHRVVENIAKSAERSIPAMLITPRMLEHHLNWVGRRFEFVSLDEIGAQAERGRAPAKPLAAVTFDDGYADVYLHAFPILKRKGIPAAFFVVTDLVGTRDLQVHDKLYLLIKTAFAEDILTARALAGFLSCVAPSIPGIERVAGLPEDAFTVMRELIHKTPQAEIVRMIGALESRIGLNPYPADEMAPLKWEMISEMIAAGMTIGSHTKTHPALTNERRDKVIEEVGESRERLKEKLGIEIKHFAYPDGRLSPDVVGAVRASGYRYAYTTCRHRDPVRPLLTIPRKVLWENSCADTLGCFSPAIMSCHANGVFDLAFGCPHDHGRKSGAERKRRPAA